MEVPSHRACAHCRSQKVRCLPDESNSDICQRCARAGRPCVFTPLQKRKQRKRTDTRVAELEREMRAMRALLKEKNGNGGPDETGNLKTGIESMQESGGIEDQEDEAQHPSDAPSVAHTHSQLVAAGRNVIQQQKVQHATSHEPTIRGVTNTINGRKPDVVDRGILSMDVARRLVSHYKLNLYPQYPQVYIPCSADELRTTRPTLFLAVLAAGAESEDVGLATMLDNEILQEYANRSVVQSEKSVELVQALLVSAVWYLPPNKFGQLKYYEYIHMAAMMAADIGITTRPSKLNRSRFAARSGVPMPSMHPSEDFANPDLSMSVRASHESEGTGNIECRRSFLACYAICVGVSISLRRPAMMRVTGYTKECLDYLENSPHAAPYDHLLVAWTRLWMIGEEIGTALSFDDPGDTASLLDTTTQLLVAAFEKRLTEWKLHHSNNSFPPCLKIMYFTLRLFLHELALHIDHSPEDFKAPYQMGVIHPCGDRDIPIKPVVAAIADLTASSHALIDAFVDMGTQIARFQPIFAFVRVSFAAFVLAKLCLSAYSPESRLASAIDRSALQAEPYVDKLILFVHDVIGPKGRHVPSLFLALLFKLRQWCTYPELIQQAQDEGASSDIWPEGAKKAREYIAIEGPRITETMGSSAEASPETLHNSGGSDGSSNVWNKPAAWNGEPQATFQYVARQGLPEQPATSTELQGSINIPITPPQADGTNFEGYEQVYARFDHSNIQPNASTPSQPSLATTAVTNNWSATSQMDLDNDMFAFLNNIDPLGPPDLPGLDDWRTFATGLGPTAELGDWQTSSDTQQQQQQRPAYQ
jgi:hypothetical protein